MTGVLSGLSHLIARVRAIKPTTVWLIWLALVSLLIPLSLFAPRPVVINLAGSTTIGLEMMPALAEAYLRNRKADGISRGDGDEPGVTIVAGTFPGDWQPTRFVIRAHGTHTAFDPRDTDVHIAMASDQITPIEENDLRERGVHRDGAGENVIGVDGVAIVTHPDLHLPALSIDEVRRIFTCGVRDWSDVTGRPDGPIHVFAIRGGESGTYEIFKRKVLGDKQLCGDEDATKFDDGKQVAEAVAGTRGGIGFVSLPHAKDLNKTWIYQDDSVQHAPSKYTVQMGDYLLRRDLYLYLFPEPAPPQAATGLVNFVQSDEGQKIVDQHGFAAWRGIQYPPDTGSTPPGKTTQPPATTPAAAAGPGAEVSGSAAPPTEGSPPSCSDAPQTYRDLVSGATRHKTIRFVSGSVVLDRRAEQDIVDLLAQLGGTDKQVMLAGFADSNGDLGLNDRISKERAQAVADVLSREDIASEMKWFGEDCPTDTNATEAGRFQNRRVEVWVKN